MTATVRQYLVPRKAGAQKPVAKELATYASGTTMTVGRVIEEAGVWILEAG